MRNYAVKMIARCFSWQCRRTGLVGMVLAAFFVINAGSARADYVQMSYSLTIDASSPVMTDILMYAPFSNGYIDGYYGPFQAPPGMTTEIPVIWPQPIMPDQTIVLGIVNGLTTDGDTPVDHLVMFLNPSVATTILDQNLSFASLFPGSQESDVISWLETSVTTPSGTPDWNAAYSSLEAFLTTVHSMVIPAGDGTQSVDGYFNGPFGSAPVDATGIAFSNPQQIGSAQVTGMLVRTSVPEPPSLVLGIVGALGGPRLLLAPALSARRQASGSKAMHRIRLDSALMVDDGCRPFFRSHNDLLRLSRREGKRSQTSIFSSSLMDGCGKTPRNWVSDFVGDLGDLVRAGFSRR